MLKVIVKKELALVGFSMLLVLFLAGIFFFQQGDGPAAGKAVAFGDIGVSVADGSSIFVSCGMELSQSMLLTDSLDCSTSGGVHGIIINTDDIYLDCQGNSIFGGPSDHHAIFINGNNVEVRNCVLEDYGILLSTYGDDAHIHHNTFRNSADGVNVWWADRATIEDNSFEDLLSGAIFLQSSDHGYVLRNDLIGIGFDAISLYSSEGNNVINNDISSSRNGIKLTYGSGSNIATNFINDNTGIGVAVSGAVDSSVSGNILGNNEKGIVVEWNSALDNELINNRITDSLVDGILLQGTDPGSHHRSVLRGNTIEGSGAHGIQMVNSHDNYIGDNEVTGSARAGVYIVESHENHLENNDFSGSQEQGVAVFSSSDNFFLANRIEGNTLSGLSLLGPDLNATNVSQNNISLNGVMGIELSGTTGPALDTEISSNEILDNGGDGLFFSLDGIDGVDLRNNIVEGNNRGFVLLAGEHYTIEDNTFCGSNGLDFQCSLDLGSGVAGGVSGSGNLIGEPGEVTSCEDWPDMTTGDNFYCDGSYDLTVSSCEFTISDSDVTYFLNQDLHCSGATNPAITIGGDRVVLDCQGHTLFGTGSHEEGIRVEGDDVVVQNCIVNDFVYGINVFGSAAQILTNTVTETNFDGIVLSGTSGVLVQENNVLSSGAKGISMVGTFASQILDNYITESGDDNLFLTGSYENFIQRNEVLDSGADGMSFIASSGDNFVEANVVTGNDRGVFVEDSFANEFRDNTISTNNKRGVSLQAGSSSALNGNTIESNGLRGVSVHDSTLVSLFDNVICDNGAEDFFCKSDDGSTVSGTDNSFGMSLDDLGMCASGWPDLAVGDNFFCDGSLYDPSVSVQFDACGNPYGDVNGDGSISSDDLTMLLYVLDAGVDSDCGESSTQLVCDYSTFGYYACDNGVMYTMASPTDFSYSTETCLDSICTPLGDISQDSSLDGNDVSLLLYVLDAGVDSSCGGSGEQICDYSTFGYFVCDSGLVYTMSSPSDFTHQGEICS